MTTVTTEPQSTDALTRINPAMLTTFTTSDFNVMTTGITFTTSEITTTYDSISQDQGLGLGKS